MKAVSKGILVLIAAILCLAFAVGLNTLLGAAFVWLASKVVVGVKFSWALALITGVAITVLGGFSVKVTVKK